MQGRTPLTLITGPLGSGKTTLLRHILATANRKIAILMNEFGEIAIDTRILQGKNVQMAELGGGCVCCSLLGEFEAAVNEIIETVNPEMIVVETTGLAEPDALVFDIQESVPQVRLDGVITVIDADSLVRYPQIGHTTRIQVEAADTILLNKIDLVAETDLTTIEPKLHNLNNTASIIPITRGQIDPDLIFGIGRTEIKLQPPHHVHQLEFDSFGYSSPLLFDRARFEAFADSLSPIVYRAKGFVRFPEGTYLFNYVTGRWELESFLQDITELVFIGQQVTEHQQAILDRLEACRLEILSES